MGGEFARDGDDDDRAGFAAGLERLPASVQAAAAPLGLSAHSKGLTGASALERDAQSRRWAVVPGGLDQKPTDVAVTGLGDRSLPAPLPA